MEHLKLLQFSIGEFVQATNIATSKCLMCVCVTNTKFYFISLSHFKTIMYLVKRYSLAYKEYVQTDKAPQRNVAGMPFYLVPR